MTAQRLADEMKEAAQNEAKMIVREAQGRADLLLQKAQGRLEEIERDINELRLRRRGVEGSLEASIQALYHALEFIRDQDQPEEKVLLHRPRQARRPAASAPEAPRAADERAYAASTLLVRVIPRAAARRSPGRAATRCSSGWRRAPVDGAANDALIAFLSDVPRIALAATSRSSPARSRRDKRVRIAGLTDDRARRSFPIALSRDRLSRSAPLISSSATPASS